MNRQESIQRQFGATADRYRTSSYHSSAPDLDALCAAARLQGSERVLDIGTGTGHTALAMASGAAEVVGIDLTPAMLEQARQRGSTTSTSRQGTRRRYPTTTTASTS